MLKKVAIYSGVIPSTTFIERLIVGLANQGIQVLLFGLKEKKYFSAQNVIQHTNTDKILNKLFIYLKYSLLLFIYKKVEKQKLDKIITGMDGNSQVLKIKFYPVLYHKPDIFHIQWAKSIKDWHWVKDFNIKLVLSLRGTHITISPICDQLLASSYKTYFPKINAFHAVSNSIAKEAMKYTHKFENIKVIYSGINEKNLTFKPKIKFSETLNIISVGQNRWMKGYQYALDAFGILHNEAFNFHYTIIGVENEEKLLFQRSQLGLETNVTFFKNQTFEKVINSIKEADILLVPSLEEGIANVVIEAMALGTLVISTDCGGMLEVISNGSNGFVVTSRDPQAIALKIKQVIGLDEETRLKILKNARQTVVSKFSEGTMVTEMLNLYEYI